MTKEIDLSKESVDTAILNFVSGAIDENVSRIKRITVVDIDGIQIVPAAARVIYELGEPSSNPPTTQPVPPS